MRRRLLHQVGPITNTSVDPVGELDECSAWNIFVSNQLAQFVGGAGLLCPIS